MSVVTAAKLQVLWTIVGPIPIDVMDGFVRFRPAPKNFPHDDPMLRVSRGVFLPRWPFIGRNEHKHISTTVDGP